MSKKGLFSANLLSLELQLKSLFDEVGGVSAISFLDTISTLSQEEQKIVLERFKVVIEKITAQDIRVNSCTKEQLTELENSLYEDLVARFEHAKDPLNGPKLELLKGGKPFSLSEPIDLAKKRAEKDKSFIN